MDLVMMVIRAQQKTGVQWTCARVFRWNAMMVIHAMAKNFAPQEHAMCQRFPLVAMAKFTLNAPNGAMTEIPRTVMDVPQIASMRRLLA